MPEGKRNECFGEHSFYMASEVQIPEEGKIVLLGFCTHCSQPLQLGFVVCEPNNTIRKKETHP